MTELIHGDCIEVLRSMPDCSVDAVVTDPPYGLSFMGKKWDYDVPSVEVWAECLRVLKPGGHLLAFAGTRTQHRMAVRIEDAGFEIRDMIAYVYGSGFPKSLDVSKAIDKNNGEVGRLLRFTEWMRTTGLTSKQIDAATGTNMGGHYLTAKSQPAIPTRRLWAKLRPLCGQVPDWVDELVERIEAEREVVIKRTMTQGGGSSLQIRNGERREVEANITAPATDAAKQWDGWGTALKPALEPITVARKPLVGTVAENVLAHGTGGLNVDECRVSGEGWGTRTNSPETKQVYGDYAYIKTQAHDLGRWPANFIHDGSEEVVRLFPVTAPARANKASDNRSVPFYQAGDSATGGTSGRHDPSNSHNDNGGSAARFFYCAKASKADRDAGCEGMQERESASTSNGGKAGKVMTVGAASLRGEPKAPPKSRNPHPTVKPTDLMRYLCRLVTPPNGIVLDPFMGSGSTGKAAALEGFSFIGIEREAEYVEIAQARINHVSND